MTPDPFTLDPELDLVLERVVPVRPETVWRAWTEPEHLVRWFTPAPYSTLRAEVDLRPGGTFLVEMADPEGNPLPASPGCYLEVDAPRRLAWTDALGPGYRPTAEPFMACILTLEPEGEGGSTRYRAHVRHATAEARRKHEEMGFHEGWGLALDQLVELARELEGAAS